jgi:chorismate mutase
MVKFGAMNKNIQKDLGRIRAGIDQVDNEIVRQLARRRGLVIKLARIKKVIAVPIYDRKREQALVDRVKKWGAKHELNEEFVEVLFRLIIMNSKEVQYHEAF